MYNFVQKILKKGHNKFALCFFALNIFNMYTFYLFYLKFDLVFPFFWLTNKQDIKIKIKVNIRVKRYKNTATKTQKKMKKLFRRETLRM